MSEDSCPRCEGRALDYRDGIDTETIAAYCRALCDNCLGALAAAHDLAAHRLATNAAPLERGFAAVLGALAADVTRSTASADDVFAREREAIVLAEGSARFRDLLDALAFAHRRIAVAAGEERHRRDEGPPPAP